MKNSIRFKAGARQPLMVLLVSVLLTASAVDALAWQRNVSTTGAAGRTATRNISGGHTSDGTFRHSTMTGPNGNSATRSSQGQWDPETRSWNKSVTTTGTGGQSATRSSSATRTEDGYSKTTTATGPDGNSATRTAQGQWDPETKTWTKSVAVTGENP